MKKVITISEVVVKDIHPGKPRYVWGPDGKEFKREVGDQETIRESVNHTFEEYGIDITDLEMVLIKVEDEKPGIINIWYRLEVDLISFLEFLITEEGKTSKLWLGEEEEE